MKPVTLFAHGFRPFFLLAGVAALIMAPVWAASFTLGMPLGSAWPPTLWHAHEMLFGFLTSPVAGFLLTAVPSWTGQKGLAGAPLFGLTVLWLTARLLIASSALWPPLLLATVDLAFLPALAALIARPLLRQRNRNTTLLAVLALYWLSNLVFYFGLLKGNSPLALHALHVGIDILLLLVTVIGGRIIPVFTTAALQPLGEQNAVRSHTALTVLAVASMAGVALCDVWGQETVAAGVVAAAAAVIQGARLLQWATLRTLRYPIVWVLHLAYAWLPIGLALKAVALLTGAAFAAFWLHALTIGALTTMVLAVMTRASLGHTGRALVVDPLITLAYLLLTGAAVIRVFGLSGLRLEYPVAIFWAALLWTATFVLYVSVYVPILLSPRVDGKAG